MNDVVVVNLIEDKNDMAPTPSDLPPLSSPSDPPLSVPSDPPQATPPPSSAVTSNLVQATPSTSDSLPLKETLIDRLYSKSGMEKEGEKKVSKEKQKRAKV